MAALLEQLLFPVVIVPAILPTILATMQGTAAVQQLWEASLRVWISCWRDSGSKAASFLWSRHSTLTVSLSVILQGYQYVVILLHFDFECKYSCICV